MAYFKHIKQDVVADDNNSSTTNLASGNAYTFTGIATSTLGVVGLQWSLKTDQNATVYVEQSPDETNWDVSYCYNYIASNGGQGETVQATQSYWRLRVVLTETVDTTYFRLQGVLCPIATPLPSSLSDDSRLKSESTLAGRENTNRHVWVTPTSELSTTTRNRLAGTSFDGTNKDPNFWTETIVTSGSVIQAGGEVELYTGASANGSSKYTSVRRARFVVGYPMVFNSAAKFVTAYTDDNTRRIGAYSASNGYFFGLTGSVFSVGTRKSGSDTLVSSGSFNGNYGNVFNAASGTYYKMDIEYTPIGAFWYMNDKLLHKNLSAHVSNTMTLPITIENTNSASSACAVSFDCVGAAISRFGSITTSATGKYVSNGTTVLKYGAGELHKVTVTDNQGTMLIYDGLSASGTLVASLDAAKTVGTMEFGFPFSTGLTVVVAGTPKMTIVYE